MKQLLKRVISLTPYRILHGSPNRFEAIEFSLRRLERLNYRPALIVDGGAHLGSFAMMASAIFPSSKIHMFEPQPSCEEPLAELAATRGFVFSPMALGSTKKPGRMWAGGLPNTGASIAAEPGERQVDIRISTLDDEIDIKLYKNNMLLKLDLQGYELEALQGADACLQNFEVIICEISFFAQSYEPSPKTIINYLDQRGFSLFDICALSERRRDGRLKQGDLMFVRTDSYLLKDTRWE